MAQYQARITDKFSMKRCVPGRRQCQAGPGQADPGQADPGQAGPVRSAGGGVLVARVPCLILCLILSLIGPILFPGSLRADEVTPDGHYAFPLDGPIELMTWSRLHWDGSNEVDIEAAPELRHGSSALDRFERLPVVATTAGVVRRADNERGGIALLLEGDDGRRYYYSHLSEARVGRGAPGMRVSAGERIGTIGRTGRWSRYIETHLHFSVTDPLEGMINAADWFQDTFGLPPTDLQWPDYLPDRPAGTPVPGGYRLVRSFTETQRENPDAASVEIAVNGPVVSVLTGEVRVMRNTVFGRRVQVTNRHTDQTVVISGLSSVAVATADGVRRGDLLGRARGVINVMYFDEGRLRDPVTAVPGW